MQKPVGMFLLCACGSTKAIIFFVKILTSMNSRVLSFSIVLATFLSGCYSEPVDLCEGVYCDNGYCNNGNCICYDGYGGAACTTQLAPLSIRITSITVTDFPAYNNGSAWDANGTAPDIFPSLSYKGASSLIWEADTYFSNATPGVNYTWDTSINITQIATDINFVLLNYDEVLGGSYYMGGVNGAIYWSNNGFPTTITRSYGGYSFELTVTYTW